MEDEKQSIYEMLGISDERGKEIAEDVLNIMTSANHGSDAFSNIAKKYDTEGILAGIRFEFLLNTIRNNKEIADQIAKQQNSPMN